MCELHPEELKNTGLAPSDFELLSSQISPKLARQDGYHPDDQHREHKMERHDDR